MMMMMMKMMRMMTMMTMEEVTNDTDDGSRSTAADGSAGQCSPRRLLSLQSMMTATRMLMTRMMTPIMTVTGDRQRQSLTATVMLTTS
jgi:hypothetical protein